MFNSRAMQCLLARSAPPSGMRRVSRRSLSLLAVLLLADVSCALAADATAVFHADKLAEIDAAISLAISDGFCPGGVLWIERKGVSYHKAFGNRALEPAREAMTEDTIFD